MRRRRSAGSPRFAAAADPGSARSTFERVITGPCCLAIAIGFTASFFLVVTPPPMRSRSGLAPRFQGTESVLSVSGDGATVMPHAVYLHSGLRAIGTGTPDPPSAPLLRVTRWMPGLAMLIAGNAAMLVAALNMRGRGDAASIEGATPSTTSLGATIARALRGRVAGVRLGVVVGGRLRRRAMITQAAALERPAAGAPPNHAGPRVGVIATLGLRPPPGHWCSQVVLSFGIPFAVLPPGQMAAPR